MNFFSSEPPVVVESTVYNLAGEPHTRPEYLKSLVLRNVLSGTKDSITETLNRGYIHGPGIAMRQVFSWCQNPANFDKIKLPIGQLNSGGTLDPEAVEPSIPYDNATETIDAYKAYAGSFDYMEHARRRVFLNHWTLHSAGRNWTASFVKSTKTITLTFPASGSDPEVVDTFTVAVNINEMFIYAYYIRTLTSNGNTRDRIFYYEKGTGDATLDGMFQSSMGYGQFFPVIPVRHENTFLSSTYRNDAYVQAKKAYTKVTGGKDLDDFISEVSTNPQIGDIDFIYIVPGVAINVLDNASRKYLFKFFDALRTTQFSTDQNTFTIKTDPLTNFSYEIRIQWELITRTLNSGKSKPSVKPQEVWYDLTLPDKAVTSTWTDSLGQEHTETVNYPTFGMYYQTSMVTGQETYQYLEISGMYQENRVYGDEAVYLVAKEELAKFTESAFIIPLHFDTFATFSIVDATQLATASIFAVFNAYEEKDVPWWQTGWFSLILVVTIAIASVVLTGGAGIGLLGAHMAVGAGFGLTGMTAAIAGSVTNALAAVVIVSMIEKVATGLFGDTIGGIIAAVAGIVLINISASGTNSITFDWAKLVTPENILQITNATGTGYVNYINGETAEIVQDMQQYVEEMGAQSERLQQAFYEQFSYGNEINPLMLIDSGKQPTSLNETPATFLTRTLMTGGDIANLTLELITNFSEHSLKLPDAFT